MKAVTVIHFVRKVAPYVSTAAANKDKRMVLSVEERIKLIQQTENGKEEAAVSGVRFRLTPNDLQKLPAVRSLKIKIPSKNMREKPINTPVIHSVY
jgi:phosphopantetheine adenylyltransferase